MTKTSFLLLVVGFLGSSLLRQKIRLKDQQKIEKSLNLERDSLICQIDSLNSELMTKSIDLGRYEIIMDRVWALDSPLVEKVTKNIE